MRDDYEIVQHASPGQVRTIIAVPTFRRPDRLRQLLQALVDQGPLDDVLVLIADNDAPNRQGVAVAQAVAQAGYPAPIEVIVVRSPGLCHVRNALFAQSLAHASANRIAMVDDDEWTQPGWLAALRSVQHRTGAAVVGGPVDPHFAEKAPRWADQTLIFRPEDRAEGRTSLLYAGNNLLVSVDALRKLDPPWFDPAFDQSGGEDLDFLCRLRTLGFTFAWAPNARVSEWVGPERARRAWVLRRMWRIGVTDTMVARKHRLSGTWLPGRACALFAMRTAALPSALWMRSRRLDIAGQWVKAAARLYALAGGGDAIYAAPAPSTEPRRESS